MLEVLISSFCVVAGIVGLLLFPVYMDKSLKRLGFRRQRVTSRKHDKPHKPLK